MAEDLDPSGRPVRTGGVVLLTPGLTGRVEVHRAGDRGMRGAEHATPDLDSALASAGMEPQLTVELSGVARTRAPRGRPTRGAAPEEPVVEVELPGPGDGQGQVLLSVDEAGTCRWHTSVAPPATRGRSTRGETRRTYRIPAPVVAAPRGPASRGLIGAVGSKLLKLVVFPLVDPVIGKVGKGFAARWEGHHRPYSLRTYDLADRGTNPGPSVDAARWRSIAEGPALLFVHGTFSRAASAFTGIDEETLTELHRRYAGRVFALDHPTLSVDPAENVAWLRKALSDAGVHLSAPLDVVAHSRGGLVARALAESGEDSVQVRTVVHVGVPNGGTTLADSEHLRDLLDTYTNLLTFFPDIGVTDVLEVVLSVVKEVAVAVHAGLPGLNAMDPHADYLKHLNGAKTASPATYHAVASDFEPTQPGLREWAKDTLLDHVFGGSGNDLVVPADGVWSGNGHPSFPIADALRIPSSAGVWHSGYFRHPPVRTQLLDWLPGSS